MSRFFRGTLTVALAAGLAFNPIREQKSESRNSSDLCSLISDLPQTQALALESGVVRLTNAAVILDAAGAEAARQAGVAPAAKSEDVAVPALNLTAIVHEYLSGLPASLRQRIDDHISGDIWIPDLGAEGLRLLLEGLRENAFEEQKLGKIDLVLRKEADHVVLEITNTGSIHEDDLRTRAHKAAQEHRLIKYPEGYTISPSPLEKDWAPPEAADVMSLDDLVFCFGLSHKGSTRGRALAEMRTWLHDRASSIRLLIDGQSPQARITAHVELPAAPAPYEPPRADLPYIESFLTAFRDALAHSMKSAGPHPTFAAAFPDSGERFNSICTLFRSLRRKDQPDFWMQPTLMLDENQAILLFKDGPNGLRYGSQPIAYRFSFTDPLPAAQGADLRDALWLPREHSLERYHEEERVYLAMRAIGHAPILNTTNIVHGLRGHEDTINLHHRLKDANPPPPEFWQLYDRARTRRQEGLEKLNRWFRIATHRSRREKIMRFDETVQIIESVADSMPDLKDALRAMESAEAFLHGKAEWAAWYELFRFPKEFECLRQALDIARGLDAFMKGEIPDQETNLEDVIRLGTIEPPRDVYIVNPTDTGSTPVLFRQGIDSDGGRIRLILPEASVLRDTHVRGNYRFLSFAIDNALKGAVRVSRPDQDVDLVVTVDDQSISIAVSDDGPGIPDSKLWKISDADYTTKAGETGHAVTRRVVLEDHGGRVHIDTRTTGHSGTTITLSWPRTPSAGRVEEDDAASRARRAQINEAVDRIPAVTRDANRIMDILRAVTGALHTDAPLYPIPAEILEIVDSMTAQCAALVAEFSSLRQEPVRAQKGRRLEAFLQRLSVVLQAFATYVANVQTHEAVPDLRFHQQEAGVYEDVIVESFSDRIRRVIESIRRGPADSFQDSQTLSRLGSDVEAALRRFHLADPSEAPMIELNGHLETMRLALAELAKAPDFREARRAILDQVEREMRALVAGMFRNIDDPRWREDGGSRYLDEFDRQRQDELHGQADARRQAAMKTLQKAQSAFLEWLERLAQRKEAIKEQRTIKAPVDRWRILSVDLARFIDAVTALHVSFDLVRTIVDPVHGAAVVTEGVLRARMTIAGMAGSDYMPQMVVALQLPAGSRVLSLGCGDDRDGIWGSAALLAGLHYTGVDSHQEAIEKANASVKRLESFAERWKGSATYLCTSIQAFQPELSSMAAVLLSNVLDAPIPGIVLGKVTHDEVSSRSKRAMIDKALDAVIDNGVIILATQQDQEDHAEIVGWFVTHAADRGFQVSILHPGPVSGEGRLFHKGTFLRVRKPAAPAGRTWLRVLEEFGDPILTSRLLLQLFLRTLLHPPNSDLFRPSADDYGLLEDEFETFISRFRIPRDYKPAMAEILKVLQAISRKWQATAEQGSVEFHLSHATLSTYLEGLLQRHGEIAAAIRSVPFHIFRALRLIGHIRDHGPDLNIYEILDFELLNAEINYLIKVYEKSRQGKVRLSAVVPERAAVKTSRPVTREMLLLWTVAAALPKDLWAIGAYELWEVAPWTVLPDQRTRFNNRFKRYASADAWLTTLRAILDLCSRDAFAEFDLIHPYTWSVPDEWSMIVCASSELLSQTEWLLRPSSLRTRIKIGNKPPLDRADIRGRFVDPLLRLMDNRIDRFAPAVAPSALQDRVRALIEQGEEHLRKAA